MNDEQIIKQINESKSEQKLRESIIEGREFSTTSVEDKQVLEKYENMSESEKANFTNKGWKND